MKRGFSFCIMTVFNIALFSMVVGFFVFMFYRIFLSHYYTDKNLCADVAVFAALVLIMASVNFLYVLGHKLGLNKLDEKNVVKIMYILQPDYQEMQQDKCDQSIRKISCNMFMTITGKVCEKVKTKQVEMHEPIEIFIPTEELVLTKVSIVPTKVSVIPIESVSAFNVCSRNMVDILNIGS